MKSNALQLSFLKSQPFCTKEEPIKVRFLWITKWLVLFLLCLSLWGVLSGCVIGTVGESSYGYGLISCKTEIKKCKLENRYAHIEVLPTMPRNPECNSIYDNFKPGLGALLYCDKAWKVFSWEYDKLRGASLIRTRYEDRHSTMNDGYMTITTTNEIQGIYVAYDSRSTQKPHWLTEQFNPVTDPDTGEIYRLRTSIPGEHGDVDLELWRKSHHYLYLGQHVFSLGGNSGEGAAWPPEVAKNRAMYVVFIEHFKQNSGQCGIHEWLVTQDCYEEPPNQGLLKAKEEAQKSCEELFPFDQFDPYKSPPEFQCGNVVCKDDHAACPADVSQTQSSLKMIPRKTFLLDSEVTFTTNSTVEVKIDGKPYSQLVDGTLDFEYELDTNTTMDRLRINSMILHINPISTDVGDFENISFALLVPFDAFCTDSLPPIAYPCDNYAIKKGDLIASLAFKSEESVLTTIMENDPIDVKIDHLTQTFQIQGGPLVTHIEIDDEDIPLTMFLDLTGRFDNFAPRANTVESTSGAECIGGYNATPLFLDASASFDIYYDKLPPIAYEWYEDYGLVTEKFWGNTATVMIPPYHLDWGEHIFTLVVRDSAGIADTDTVPVTVYDSKPPTLIIPPDVYAVSVDGSPMKIEIGPAFAADTCSSRSIPPSNNAPFNLIFPGGQTKVIWEADDGMGNISTAVQNVFVFTPSDLVDDKQFLVQINLGIERSGNVLRNCGDDLLCMVDLKGLIGLINQRELVLEEGLVSEERRGDIRVTDEVLHQVRDELNEVETLLRQSIETRRERREKIQLRLTATQHLNQAYELTQEHLN